MYHKKFGPDRFSRFDIYWIQTNKQTNKRNKQNRNSVEYLNVLVERIRENNPQTIIQVGQYHTIYIHISKLKNQTRGRI